MLASGGLTSASMFSGLQDLSTSTSPTLTSSLTNFNLSFPNIRTRDISSNQETSTGFPDYSSSISLSPSLSAKSNIGSANLDMPGPGPLTLPRKFSTYAERISTASSLGDGTSLAMNSPKIKKTGTETREELFSLLSRSNTLAVTETGSLPATNGGMLLANKAIQLESQQGNSFTLQLFQRTLEETLDSFQKSIHEDMRNLHIEILRQFHMQEMEFSGVTSSILENQAELMREIKSLRKENPELRRLF